MYGKMQASGLTEFIPFICILAAAAAAAAKSQHPLDRSFGTLIHIWRPKVMMALTFLVY